MVTKLGANALWDWIKTKVKGRSPAAAEAVEGVEQAQADPITLDILRAQLRKALAEDPTLRAELAALLSKHAPSVVQNAAVTGHANAVIQNTDSGSINVQC